ncbi:MAG: helix-turn-helix transcriptional regulator [Clostridia bacterium]
MINKIIVKLRKEYNLTQKEIANKLSMSRTGYASWEQGLSEPNTSDIKKLCVIFNISADELLEIETAEERKKIVVNNSFNNNIGKQNIKF